ncbi:glycosyltransferase [candidate division WOR-3 bacterium]|nr:glycosyltransferase [candidate division WOR-3 bacterium]
METRKKQEKFTVCYFGTYLPEYPRNKVLIEGLRLQGINVKECHYPLWHGIEPRISKIKGLRRKAFLTAKILWAYCNLLSNHHNISEYDVMLVGYTGHFDVLLAKILSSFRRKPLIFDFFWSMYCTFIEDRKIFLKNSLMAKLIKYIDIFTYNVSDVLLLDTQTHIKYISKTLNLDEKKFKPIWVGADESVFYPVKQRRSNNFQILFFGTFIPLQGIETIIKAAKLLEKEEILFKIIGKGQLSSRINNLSQSLELKNCTFVEWVPLEKLVDEISQSDICLGIFGASIKASSVIPNKVFDSIACKKPCITEDSPAIREIFTNKKDILLVPPEDEHALAKAILTLRDNDMLRENISKNAYTLFLTNFTKKSVGKQLKDIIENTIKGT